MAIMIPDTIRQNAKQAERRLFNRFRSEVPDDCYVLHSLGLVTHETKIWGECDYVILSRMGVYVIEVKGGRVSCEDGMWRFTDRNGFSNTKPEGPFEQASSAMFAIRKSVEESANLRGFLFGYGVIMPDEEFLQHGPEMEPGVLLDRRQIHNRLDEYIRRLRTFWTKQYADKHDGRIMRDPEKGDLEKIRAILRPDIRTALTLNSSLCRVEQEQVELIEQQSRILQRMDTNPRTLLSGGAGTGKTLLALDTAARRARQGQRTLYLCYNRLLGRHVREHVSAHYSNLPLEADNLHGWFRRMIDQAGLSKLLDRNASDDEYFRQRYSDAYEEALIELNYEPFDCLIIDEAQDLLSRPYVDALDLTLRDGLAAGMWHIFLDPLQTIHSGFDPSILPELKNYGYADFQLTVNCRNTRKVAVSTSIISGFDIPLEDAVEGGECDTRFVVRDGRQFKGLENLIEKLLKDGVSRSDIIILSKHPLRNSTLAEIEALADSRICDFTADDAAAARRGIDFCTMHAFKGLDRKIVIAWDLADLDNEQNRLLHYCGLSRARSCLFVFINASEQAAYERLATEFGARQARITQPDYESGRHATP